MTSNLGGIGAGAAGIFGFCMIVGSAIYVVGPCIGGATTKVLPYGASWDRPIGVVQTFCAAISGAGSDIYSNVWGEQVHGRVAGTIPITGRGGNLSRGQQKTNGDLGGNNGPYNEVVPLDKNMQIEMWRKAHPDAPADATPWNTDGGFDWPMVNTSYRKAGMVGGDESDQEQYRQCAGAADTNCDGVLSLGELGGGN